MNSFVFLFYFLKQFLHQVLLIHMREFIFAFFQKVTLSGNKNKKNTARTMKSLTTRWNYSDSFWTRSQVLFQYM